MINGIKLTFFICLSYGFCAVYFNTCTSNRLKFSNPILAGFYPDPSICQVDSDYYLVNSTFAYFPGIPVFHSRDLVNWKLLGHVLDRAEILNLDSLGVSRGIFAPSLRYHRGIFYVTCTLVDRGGNFIVTAESAAGPWSDPVWLPQINGIDPSLFFAENGKCYIVYNSIPPDDKPLYDGHRTIRMYEFSTESLKVTGQEHILINGGTDIRKKPVWIEGPHVFQKDGFYYLIAAEGGTGDQHSEVVFRSSTIEGPYIAYRQNPILTQRHLNPQREFPITSTGHADLVQIRPAYTQKNASEWWAVFLGCRPYRPFDQGYYNTGRETFLAPVKWIDGWPIINPDHQQVQYFYSIPTRPCPEIAGHKYSGNFKIRDDFDTGKLDPDWVFLRTPHERWYDLGRRKGYMALHVRAESCSGKGNPTFRGHRQQHLQGLVNVALDFLPTSANEKAGLLVFQNETHFYFLCKSRMDDDTVVELYKSRNDEKSADQMELIVSQRIEKESSEQNLYLQVEVRGAVYTFRYSFSPDRWTMLKDSIDARFLSTRLAGGFVGSMYALYATSLGKSSKNTAYFDWFEYIGADEVYR